MSVRVVRRLELGRALHQIQRFSMIRLGAALDAATTLHQRVGLPRCQTGVASANARGFLASA